MGVCVAIVTAVLAAIYWVKPDSAAALTIWPALIPFGILALANLAQVRRRNWKAPLAQSTVIGAVGMAVMDSPMALFRTGQSAELTVVSLNCAGGTPAAMKEVAAFHPDIVLLQERPGANQVRAFSEELFALDYAAIGPDAAVLSRWPVVRSNGKPTTTNMNHAWVILQHPLGRIAVCSLRLQPPVFRLDLWSPDAWQTYTRNKVHRRVEFFELVRALPPEFKDSNSLAIMGGDFNTPPDNTITQPIAALKLRDSFWDHGIGLGGTAVNDYPVVRIDQVWSRGFETKGTYAVKTVNSDHRMVIAKFSIPTSK